MSQSSSADIDLFRLRVLQQIVDTETTKQNETARKQRTCFHVYEPQLYDKGHIICICSKCDRQLLKRL